MRDKLIKLIREAFQPCEMYRAMLIADHLIANGVTVLDCQKDCKSCWKTKLVNPAEKWISVKDRLPEANAHILCFFGDYIDILKYRYNRVGELRFMYMDECGYWHERYKPSVTHWMPLPEPPKGE